MIVRPENAIQGAAIIAAGPDAGRRFRDRSHAVLMVLAAVVTVLYWISYFASGTPQARADAVYLGFESSFPIADGWMTLSLLAAAFFLWRGEGSAVPWGLCAGSAMVYLASMDLLFDLEQGNFRMPLNAEMQAEALIVTFCWLFGPFTVWRMWHHPLRRQWSGASAGLMEIGR